jgi:hypothetical protein
VDKPVDNYAFKPQNPIKPDIFDLWITIKPGYTKTMQHILNDPYILFIYWIYAMLGLSGLAIIWATIEFFRD